MRKILYTALAVLLFWTSTVQAITIRNVVETWPELKEFKGGRHAFVFNPDAYVFTILGDRYRLEHAVYDRRDGETTNIETQAGMASDGRYTQLAAHAKTGGPLQVPTLYYKETETEAKQGIHYRFSFRPESYEGEHTGRETRHDFMTFLNNVYLSNLKLSPYVYRATGDDVQGYRRNINGKEHELRLVYLFGYDGRFEDFANEYNLWDLPVKEVVQDGKPLLLWLYPSSRGVYETQAEKDLAARLEREKIQVMISVRNHAPQD